MTSTKLKTSSQKVALRYLLGARKRFWHGTSSKYLRGILKQGLIPATGKSQYGDTGGAYVSIETFGGIYLTDNFMNAFSHAGNASSKSGGNRLLVGLTFETRSPEALPDEDSIVPLLSVATNTSSGYDLTNEPRSFWYQGLRSKNLVGWSGIKPTDFDKVIDLMRSQDLSKPIKTFFKEVVRKHPRFESRYQRQKEKLDNLLEDVLRKHAIYLLYLHHREYAPTKIKGLQQSIKSSLERGDTDYISSYEDSIRAWENPPPEISPSSFREMERAITRMSGSLREMLDDDDQYQQILRSMGPITYRGKNRIQTVTEVIERKSDSVEGWGRYSDIVFHYAQSPSLIKEFVKDYFKTQGGSYRVIYRNRMLSYHLISRQEWPTDLWGQPK